jgi:hypothetical protein
MYNNTVLVVTLWEKKNYAGKKRVFPLFEDNQIPQGIGNLTAFSFNNKASSIQIQKGPKYYTKMAQNLEPRVVLFEDVDFVGYPPQHAQEYGVGDYPFVPEKWSSLAMKYVGFTPPPPGQPSDTVDVRLVLELYADENHDGRRIFLWESCTDLAKTYGFNELTSSAKLFAGPNVKANDRVKLYKDKNFGGTPLLLNPGDKPKKLKDETPNLDNKVSSVEFLL